MTAARRPPFTHQRLKFPKSDFIQPLRVNCKTSSGASVSQSRTLMSRTQSGFYKLHIVSETENKKNFRFFNLSKNTSV